MANILITGGSGIIGIRLSELLVKEGFNVGHLTRSSKAKDGEIKYFNWAPDSKFIDPMALPWADHIVHLAGETVGQRWTTSVKKKILTSRVETTMLLINELEKNNHHLKSFVSASAIGYYGDDRGNELQTESSQKGQGFLSDVVADWELSVDGVKDYSDNVVKIRIGIVLTKEYGALSKMALPIRFGVGSALGSGKQWMSWIHVDDLCKMFLKAILEPMKGIYNGVGPNPVTNEEFTKILAWQLKRPLILPKVPAFVLKLLLGDMSVLALGSIKAAPDAFVREGFIFEFKTLGEALKSLV